MTRTYLKNPIRTVKQQAHARTLNQAELHQELRRADTIINQAWHIMGINSQIQLVHDLSLGNVTHATDPLAECPRNLALNRTVPYISPMTEILQLIVLILTVAVITLSISNTITTTENKYLKTKLATHQTANSTVTKESIMRRNYALNLDPTVFPKAMKLVTDGTGQQLVSTQNMTKYLGSIHIWVHCTVGAIRHEIKQLTLEQLNQLSNEFDCTGINLTLQDSIFDGDGKADGEGDFLDQFGYALVLRSMTDGDVFTNLKKLLNEIAK